MMTISLELYPKKGDWLVGLWPSATDDTWPRGWTLINSQMAWRRYDGIMVDHVPFVLVFRAAGSIEFSLVLTAGDGAQGMTLDELLGDFPPAGGVS